MQLNTFKEYFDNYLKVFNGYPFMFFCHPQKRNNFDVFLFAAQEEAAQEERAAFPNGDSAPAGANSFFPIEKGAKGQSGCM